MYCSSCGGAVAQGLGYCNQCGAKLGGAKSESLAKRSETFSESLVWAIVGIFVIGTGVTIGLIAVLKDMLNLDSKLIAGFALLVFLMMFVIEGVFIAQLMRHRRGAEAAGDAGLPQGRTTRELDAAQARQLPEHMPSVIEHTTRTLEPIYDKRKSK